MRRDFYSYAKLGLLDDARLYVACNEEIELEERTSIINSINEEYIQTINEAEGVEFQSAKNMIGDISSSYVSDEATEVIMQKLFCEHYAFQDEIYDFSESLEFIDYFDKEHIFKEGEDVTFDNILDNINIQSKTISSVAKETDFSM